MVNAWTEQGTGPARLPRVEKVSQHVAREIVATIVNGRLAPGAVLPSEAEMIDALGVGRASLREALRLLEVQGLVAMRPGPGGGPVVGAADHAHFGRMATLFFQVAGATFADILAARTTLEPMMVRSIAEEQPPAALERFQQMLELDLAEEEGYAALATEFHSVVAGCTRNPVLNLVSSAVSHVYAERVPGRSFPLDRRHEVVAEHLEVIRAVVDSRADDAEWAMRRHMASMSADVSARFPGLLDELVDWR